MSVVWTLSAGGVTKSLVDWGIKNLRLTFKSLDVDEMTFSVPTADVTAAEPFAYNEQLVLWRDGVRWFTGTVTRLPSIGTGETEQFGYTVSGPWWQLERIIYQQFSMVQNEAFDCLVGQMSTRVVLGQDVWGNKLSTNQQIFNICVYALYKGLGFLPMAALPTLTTPPLEECRDISCAEAIKRCLRWTPDASAWFDYSATVPVLYVSQRPFITTIQLDLADKNLVEGVEGITPRYDLQPPGVLFTYLTSVVNPADGSSYIKVTRDSAGYGDALAGCIVATFELAGQGGGTPEAPPTGLAEAFYLSLHTYLYWEGSIRLHELDCSGYLRPGSQLNLLNGRTAWAGMYTPIQVVTEDVDRGITEAQFGPAEHLGPQDFFAQMMWLRNKPTPTTFSSTMHNGTAGATSCGCNPTLYAAAQDAEAAAAAAPTNAALALAALQASAAACGPVPQPNVPPVENQAGPGGKNVAAKPSPRNQNGLLNFNTWECTDCDGYNHTVVTLD